MCIFVLSIRICFAIRTEGWKLIDTMCRDACVRASVYFHKHQQTETLQVGLIRRVLPGLKRALDFTTPFHRSYPASSSTQHRARKMFSARVMVVGAMLTKRAYRFCKRVWRNNACLRSYTKIITTLIIKTH